MKGSTQRSGDQKRKKPDLRPWDEQEVKKLIVAYKAGKRRAELASLLGRTTGSVANKTRLLIAANVIPPRKIKP